MHSSNSFKPDVLSVDCRTLPPLIFPTQYLPSSPRNPHCLDQAHSHTSLPGNPHPSSRERRGLSQSPTPHSNTFPACQTPSLALRATSCTPYPRSCGTPMAVRKASKVIPLGKVCDSTSAPLSRYEYGGASHGRMP